MALTVEELQIVLSCDATTAQTVLKQMEATVKAYTDKFQSYFDKLGMDKNPKTIVGDVKAVEKQLDNVTNAIESKGKDWKAAYAKTWGETFEQSMSKVYKNTGEYIPSGQRFIPSESWDRYERMQREASLSQPTATVYPGAASKLAGLSSALDTVRSKASEIGAALKEAFAGSGEKATAAGGVIKSAFQGAARVASAPFKALSGVIRGIGSVAKNVGAKIKSAFKSTVLGKFIKQLGRTMMRMAAMKLIRGTIDGIKKGLEELAKTSKSSSEAMNTIKAAGGSIKMALGSAVMPIVKALAPVFKSLAEVVSVACDAIARFFAVITGQGTYTAVRFSDSLDAVSESAGGAGKAVKGSLAAFDELVVIGNKGGGGGGGSGVGSSFSTVEDDVTAVSDFANMVKEAWAKADFSEIGSILANKIKDGLDNIPWDGINETLSRVVSSITSLLNGFFQTEGLGASVGSTIGEAFNSAYNSVAQFVETLDWSAIGSFITSGLQSAFDTFDFGNLTAFISSKLKAVFKFGSGLLDGIDWGELPSKFATAVGEAFAGFDFKGLASSVGEWLGKALKAGLDFIGGLADWLGGLVDKIKAYFTEHIDEAKEAGGSVLSGILAGIVDGLKNIGTWIKTNILDPFISGFKSAFGIASPAKEMEGPGEMVGEGILAGISNALTRVEEIFTAFKDIINAYLGIAGEYVMAFLQTLGENVSAHGTVIKGSIQRLVNSIKISVLKKIQSLVDSLNDGPVAKLLKAIGVDLTGASKALGSKIKDAEKQNRDLDKSIKAAQATAAKGFNIEARVDKTKVDKYKKTISTSWKAYVAPNLKAADKKAFNEKMGKGITNTRSVRVRPELTTPSVKVEATLKNAEQLTKQVRKAMETSMIVRVSGGGGSAGRVTLMTRQPALANTVANSFTPSSGYSNALTANAASPLSELYGLLTKANDMTNGSSEEVQLLREQNTLLRQIARKQLVISPSVALGQVIDRSQRLYART